MERDYGDQDTRFLCRRRAENRLPRLDLTTARIQTRPKTQHLRLALDAILAGQWPQGGSARLWLHDQIRQLGCKYRGPSRFSRRIQPGVGIGNASAAKRGRSPRLRPARPTSRRPNRTAKRIMPCCPRKGCSALGDDVRRQPCRFQDVPTRPRRGESAAVRARPARRNGSGEHPVSASTPADAPAQGPALEIVDEKRFAEILAANRGKSGSGRLLGDWCIECLELMPHTVRLYDTLRDRGAGDPPGQLRLAHDERQRSGRSLPARR